MEPERPCPSCGKKHFDNCNPEDLPKTSDQARKIALMCYAQTVEAAAEVRAKFSEYLKKLQNEEAAIDAFLASCEKFVWHICILNKLNWQMGFRELGTNLFLLLPRSVRSLVAHSQIGPSRCTSSKPRRASCRRPWWRCCRSWSAARRRSRAKSCGFRRTFSAIGPTSPRD